MNNWVLLHFLKFAFHLYIIAYNTWISCQLGIVVRQSFWKFVLNMLVLKGITSSNGIFSKTYLSIYCKTYLSIFPSRQTDYFLQRANYSTSGNVICSFEHMFFSRKWHFIFLSGGNYGKHKLYVQCIYSCFKASALFTFFQE